MPDNGQRKTLTDIATRHQVFLERLKTHEANDFALVFDQLNRATREVIAELGVSNLSEVSKTKLTKVLADLRATNLEFLDKAQNQLFENLEKLAGYESGFEARSFQSISARVRLKTVDAKDAFEDALARPLSVDGNLLEPFFKKWATGEVDRVNNVIRKSWGEGWSVDRLTSAINGTKKLNYADGILGVPDSTGAVARRNARAVARTGLHHVASSARMVTWEKNADIITGYRLVATLDGRTTQKCRSLDGKFFELGSGPVPPLHIGCRTTTVAEVDPAFDFLDEGATRSSETGYVDADMNYYDWLKTQPAAFQDEAIGKTRAKLLRDGGLTSDEFAALNIGRNFEPLTLEQMQKLEPLAFERAGLN